MREVVDAFVTGRARTITECADLVGLRRETVSRMLRKEHVIAHLRQRRDEELGRYSALAVPAVGELMLNAKSEYVRLEAAKDILDRTDVGKLDDDPSRQARQVVVNINFAPQQGGGEKTVSSSEVHHPDTQNSAPEVRCKNAVIDADYEEV